MDTISREGLAEYGDDFLFYQAPGLKAWRFGQLETVKNSFFVHYSANRGESVRTGGAVRLREFDQKGEMDLVDYDLDLYEPGYKGTSIGKLGLERHGKRRASVKFRDEAGESKKGRLGFDSVGPYITPDRTGERRVLQTGDVIDILYAVMASKRPKARIKRWEYMRCWVNLDDPPISSP